jgi:hypothetical protein
VLWVLLVLGLVQVWWLWEVRKSLGLRARPRLIRTTARLRGYRADFHGAVPPARYCVVRWPDGQLLYNGCVGALAREAYERVWPEAGQEVELWELEHCRGHKP